MQDLNLQVAQNLRRIREERKLSLDRLSELTGVSKSMLGQIERSASSPTIATIWKIANGLKVSFTTLFNAPEADTTLVHAGEIAPLLEDSGRYRLYPFFPIEEGRRFEVYKIEIDPGGFLSAEAHPEGTQEFITVFSGELTVRVDQTEVRVETGSAIRFRADRVHTYHNTGTGLTQVSMVIEYK